MTKDCNVWLVLEIYVGNKWVEVKTYPLEKICVLLGRNKSLNVDAGDIVIDDKVCSKDIYNVVSSIHLTFFRRSTTEKENNKYRTIAGYSVKDGYQDRASTNGTLLNGKFLKEKVNLYNGDVLQIGKRIRLTYYQNEIRSVISHDKDTYSSIEETF